MVAKEAKAQAQCDKEFAAHKQSVLQNLSSASACDLSPKGSVDVKCHPIMDLLNTHADYITTSSCSGRIALFHSTTTTITSNSEVSEEKDAAAAAAATMMTSGAEDSTRGERTVARKRGDERALGWLAVKHGLLRPREMLAVVHYLCGPPRTAAERTLDAEKVQEWQAHYASSLAAQDTMYEGEFEGVLAQYVSPTSTPNSNNNNDDEDAMDLSAVARPAVGTLCLKVEPFVMHIACRTMTAAKTLLSAAVSDSGFRNSGVTPPGRRTMCAIRTAAGLGMEVPVILDGVNYVEAQRGFVWALLSLANAKMSTNERRVRLLERSIAHRLQSRQE